MAFGNKREIKPIEGPGAFWILIIIVLILLAGSILLLNKPSSGPPTEEPTPTASETPDREPRIYTVTYKAGFFSPTNLRIHAGDTVRFRNDHFAGLRIITDPHPQHSQLMELDSVGDIPSGGDFPFTFERSGIFGYHNENRPSEGGTIIVR